MARISYQEKLSRQFNRYIVSIALVLLAALSALLLLHTFFITQFQNLKNNQLLCQQVEEDCLQWENFLRSEESQNTFLSRLRDQCSDNHVSYFVNSFSLERDLEGGLILSDRNGEIVYNSVVHDHTNLHLSYFHSLLAENVIETGTELYDTIYQKTGETGCYVLAVPVYNQNRIRQGVAAVYISGGNWEDEMRQNQFDGVVVGGNDYVLAVSNPGLLDGLMNRFAPEEGGFYSAGGRSYRQTKDAVAKYGLTVFTYQQTGDMLAYYMVLVLAICVLLLALLFTGRTFSHRIADLNARSVETLHEEITTIQDRAGKHRIELHTDDEFETIAEHINTMLDHLDSLNQRNMELARLNNQMERLQLEAQFDPHFLYNTLESIRYGVRLGDKGIDSMILRLTGLLRYSISPAESPVTLEEDLGHLQDYLDIIHYRFQSRFHYSINIPDNCLSRYCPKLLLQPLVENSVKYGLQCRKTLTVTIRGWEEEGFLCLEVRDDGPGIEPERLEELRALIASGDRQSTHHGLKNVARRLQLQFGSDSTLNLASRPGEGTAVRIRVAHTEGLL